MEQLDSSQSHLSGARVALIVFAVLLAGLIGRYFLSGLTRSAGRGQPFTIAVLTTPPALVELTPDKGRVRFSIARQPAGAADKTARERAGLILSAVPQQAFCGDYYFQPAGSNPSALWDKARETALGYRARPQLAGEYLAGYLSALFSGRTNIAPDEFYIITAAFIRARPDAFISVLNAGSEAEVSGGSEQPAAENPNAILRTLTIEVLNGSGTPGMALEATKYIRSLAGPDFKVDVLRHDNSPRSAKTRFIVYTDREDDIAKLGARLGLGVQIDSSHSDIGDTDARLILGRDFKLPR